MLHITPAASSPFNQGVVEDLLRSGARISSDYEGSPRVHFADAEDVDRRLVDYLEEMAY